VTSLLVTNDFPPKVGGIQSYLHELWRRLPPEETTVLTTPYEGAEAFDAAQPFRVERVREPVLVPMPGLAGRIDALAREVGADVIFLDPALPLGAVGRRLKAAPHVLIAHGAEITLPGRLPGSRGLLRHTLRAAAGVVAAGEWTAAAVARVAGMPVPTVVIPPGVDTARFRPPLDHEEQRAARVRFGLDAERPVVLGLSRLVPRKGFDVLLDAFAELGCDAQLAIGGRGRDLDRLEARARLLGLGDRTKFLGRIPEEDLPLAYRAADVFGMLCRDRWMGLEAEGYGIVFLEAAASGVPAVAGRSGGSHEAVRDGETGFVDDPDDVMSVSQHLEALLLDRTGREARSRAARAWAETCDYDRRVEPLVRLARGDLSVLEPRGA
jgi:phosphatidylinositol alpha-1,6-mannosyltransferase